MKYLFFDTECANCYFGIGKICKFGYVIIDKDFNIIEEEDILMSPGKSNGSKFDKKIIREENLECKLAYTPDDYYKSPLFPKFYKRLKALFEDEDTMVFGYSVDNDIRYLDSTLKRYFLEPYIYIAYDIQEILKKVTNSDSLIKLKVGYNELVKEKRKR